MFGLGAGEIFVIAVLALIFIGPKKLPELAKGLGKGIREFQKAKNDLLNEVNTEDDPTPQTEKLESHAEVNETFDPIETPVEQKSEETQEEPKKSE